MPTQTRFHGSCAARGDAGVLLLGGPGSGKSDLLLRLIDRGFDLVADDQVLVEEGLARPPERLAGLVEVRGIGLLRRRFRAPVRLSLALALDRAVPRLPPAGGTHPLLGIPLLGLDPFAASAALRVETALDCIGGGAELVAGFLC